MKMLAITVAAAELAGFATSPDRALEANRTVGRAAVWVLDVPVQWGVCHTTSILDRVNYAKDCVQSFFGSPDKHKTGVNSIESPARVDLSSIMSNLGYSCVNNQLVEIMPGDTPIGLMIGAGTSEDTINRAKEQGAFTNLGFNVGQTAVVASCI